MAAEASFVIRAVDATRAAFAAVQNTLQKTASIAASTGAAINRSLGGFGLALSVGGVAAFGKSIIDLGGYINDTARAAGLGTDAFQALAYAGKESGVTMEQIARAAEALRSKISDAVSGNESAIKTFEKLNLTGEELKAISLDKAFEVIAKRIKEAADQQEAMNVASDIFGARIGPKMREVIDKLASGSIEKLGEDMKGLTLTKEQLNALDEAGDKLDRFITQAKVLAAQGFLKLLSAGSNAAIPDGTKFTGRPGFGMSGRMAPATSLLTGLPSAEEIMGVTAAVTKSVAATDDATQAAMDAAKAERELALEFEYRQKLAYSGEDRASRLMAAEEDARRRRNAAFAEGNNIIEAGRSPLQKYNDEIERLSRLEEQGLITTDAAAVALGKAAAEFVNAEGAAEDYASRLADVMQTANKMAPAMTQLELTANRAGEMIASSFEDAVFAGAKLSDVLKNLAADLMRLIFQQTVTQPIANAISAAIIGGFRAEGGPVSSGVPYIVGEKGPEMFVPRTSGSIVPNKSLGGQAAGAGVNITYNIAAGVTKTELVPILEAERKRLQAEIPDMVRRGGAYRAAFA